MALRRDPIPSPNYSSRAGSGVRLVVLHTAQGASTYKALGSFFGNPSAGVSSHVGIDDSPGVVGEYVRRDYKAWTQANANPYSVAAELCAWAEWSPAEWAGHPAMLDNTAQWVAEECAAFGIPLRRLSAAEAQGGAAGVCQHVDLGASGGGHWDCGPGFPMAQVMDMAAGMGLSAPGTASGRQEAHNMIASTGGQGYWIVKEDGAVYAFGDARHVGGANDPDAGGPLVAHLGAGHVIVGIAGHGSDGYWLTADDGAVYAYGSADYKGRADR